MDILQKLSYYSLFKASRGIPCYLCKVSSNKEVYFCHLSSDFTFECSSSRPGGNPGMPYWSRLTNLDKGVTIRIKNTWYRIEKIEEWN